MARPTPPGLLGMSASRFLREHWQKKPLLVRGAMPELRDPLTPEEIAGLSCEEGIESRLVRERGGSAPWEVTWGPQAEATFASLPARGWTLLVQELNRHVPEAALLLERFTFLPNVRVDDVMVSYAVPGGSVGPHLDSYDVFLVQGMGKRRWQYDTRRTKDVRFRPDLDLRILTRFAPDADEVLEPGDMLYLPPGFAHHGVAVTPCLTYSIGFRAPAFGELSKAFAAHAALQAEGEAARLLADPPLVPADNPGAIPPALLERVRAIVRSVDRSDDAIDRFFASFATRLAPGHALTAPRRKLTGDAIFARLSRGDVVTRSEEGRWAYLPTVQGRGEKGSERPAGEETRRAGRPSRAMSQPALRLYVAGEELEVAPRAAELAKLLCRSRRFPGRELAELGKNAAAHALIVRLFDLGGLAFADRASARASRPRASSDRVAAR